MTDPQDSTIDRIRKLLAMAERGATEEERDAFNAKATSLMVQHAIDEALITDIGRAISEKIAQRTMSTTCPKSYSHEFAVIVCNIADALGSRGLLRRSHIDNRTNITLIGYESDLENVIQLGESLMRQCTYALGAWFKTHVRGWHSGTDKYNMKRGFVVGFAAGARDKLLAVKKQLITDAGAGSEIAIIDRETRVNTWLEENLKVKDAMRRYDQSSRAGGWGAGQRADIGGASVGGIRKSIGG